MASIRPLHDRVIVERIESETKTAGGIPDSTQEKPTKGIIISIGSGIRNENGVVVPLDVKKGDTILFAKWGGTEINIDGKDLLILKESDILGVLEGGSSAKAA